MDRFRMLPSYHYEDNTDGIISNPAELLLRDYIIEGNIGDETEDGKYKIPITVRGKNLIPYPYPNTTITNKGITFTDNGDGGINVNGSNTSGSYSNFGMYYNKTKLMGGINPGDVITISTKEKFPIQGIHIQFNGILSSGTSVFGATISINKQLDSITIPDDWIGMNMSIYVRTGTTIENFTVYPQIEFGNTATDYEMYQEPRTTNIYLDSPLGPDESISKKADNLPEITLNKGSNVITVDTEVKPKSVTYQYYTY